MHGGATMKTKMAILKKLILNKNTVSQLDMQDMEQLKAGGNPWLENWTVDPMICG